MFAFSSTQLTLFVLAGVVGGVVRGYSGFGFALAAVPLLNLVFPPAFTVPSVLIVECAIGLATVLGERIHIEKRVLARLVGGTIVGTPLGVMFLSLAPSKLMQLAVALVVFISVMVLWRRPHLPELGRSCAVFFGGVLSGLLNGGTAMSGPPAVLVLLGAPLSDRTARATLMAFILISAVFGLLVTGLSGLQTYNTVASAVMMAPGVALGAYIGVHLFRRLPESIYRYGSFAVLGAISLLTIVSTVWALT